MLVLCALLILASIPAAAQQELSSSDKIKLARNLAKGGSEGIPQLQPLLADADAEVRREAVAGLAAIGTQYSLDPLVAALRETDAEIQIRATDGLVNFYVPGYLERSVSRSLKRSGDSLNVRWREDENHDAVDPDVPARPEIVEGIKAVAGERNHLIVRAVAARALGILRASSALPVLQDGLRSKDDRLIFESLIAIQKLRDPEAGPRVVFLLRDLDEKVQKTAIETVGLLRTREAVPGLERVFREDPSKKIRRAAMTALGRIADPATHDLLIGQAQDRDEDVRAAAAEGLGRIGRAEDRDFLIKLYNDEGKANARLAQAFALVAMGMHETAEFSPLRDLLNNLNSRSWRGVAIPYLGELMMKEPVRRAVYPVIPVSTKEEKTGIALALAGCGAQDAVDPLDALVRDPDPEVGTQAVRALRIVRATIR